MIQSRRIYKLSLFALAVALFFGVAQVQRSMNRDRQELGLTRYTELKGAPPVLALTTQALGGFRGLIANALWIRMSELQEEDKFFEMVQLADWITKLEPHFVQVWTVQAWNMAYNISVKFKDPEDRWRWVQRGITLLRDEGLRYNPDETLLYRELAWFFQHKMGHNLDDAHMFYKQAWAAEMHAVLGGRPDYDELFDPQTEDAQERVTILRERYKMDPAVMKEVDEEYGPLEWRLPEAHAIYWAWLGLQKAKREDLITLRRAIYQSMQTAFMRGAFIESKFGPATLGPNLEMIANANKAYEDMMEQDEEMRDHMKTAHRNFLRNAPYFLYLYNRHTEAERWFKYLKEKYPNFAQDAVADPQVAARLTLDEYALFRVTEDVGETDVNRIRAVVGGLLTTACLELVEDNDDRAVNYERLARRVYERFQTSIEGAEQRVGLPPLSEIRRNVLDELLDPEEGLPPELAAILRTKLGLPAPEQRK